MWGKLLEQVGIEFVQLEHWLETHCALAKKSLELHPEPVELSALAAMLHPFYNGAENILKRLAMEIEGGAPSGEFWHRDLLDVATKPGFPRPPVISAEWGERLGQYRCFRHLFRHACTFDLRWESRRSLGRDSESIFLRFKADIQAFFAVTESA